ncbi:MAG: anti-sigma B factor antagonist [Actinobacteria bacterium RBG_19FT_COMBO_54_7]|uniref:Anti-sigma factor antagonist n=1 Tax=Candidatus Solincola sediminis TaxID=1797199 RepID=A0A1F2WHH0_9ACTN|nr:MAG: anti-sigma B factor antagonist [Candidatus Solincola sediminis]OFW58770.1 MAG: anti-sigma B factor antagonist [Candidatus Solincola sediminis]OFW69858.1 MAG: anti-sigma B factor antagonist [Actinobacteria bacterium RBG_19FT_COMBO_54_7]
MENEAREGAGLDIATEDIHNFSLVVLSGEVDVYSAPKLRETIKNLVDQGKNNIVVDLEKVDFLDSTGLGVLVGGLKRVKQNNGELGIICNQEKILRIFRITGLTKVFPIYASRQDLIAKTKEA